MLVFDVKCFTGILQNYIKEIIPHNCKDELEVVIISIRLMGHSVFMIFQKIEGKNIYNKYEKLLFVNL